MKKYSVICLLLLAVLSSKAQDIRGKVVDELGDPLIGAAVKLKNRSGGTITDEQGMFYLTGVSLPVGLVITYVGFDPKEIVASKEGYIGTITLGENSEQLEEAIVKRSRITEKQKESPLTVESLGVKAIQEAPAASFYESLGNLKGVDVTAASLGFRVVNTRGFNSTSPVRSLQLIDGVDNQSPGLNFSLGNFLGANDLDIKRVDIIAGASSAFYGPNAFNGVISMETKNPFDYKGMTAEFKVGERQLSQFSFRMADVIQDKEGKDRFAWKIGMLNMRAYDWEAENYNPSSDSEYGRENPGGYDAVNIYGDESLEANSDYTDPVDQLENPGLGYIYRTGYRERDLVDYNTENFKFNTALHYKPTDSTELIYAFNIGGGSTVYQGDNRYRLEDIIFWQNRIEFRKPEKFFIRLYQTKEDAGSSYDIVSTAFQLNERSKPNAAWNNTYKTNWRLFRFGRTVESLEGYPFYNPDNYNNLEDWTNNALRPFLMANNDTISALHALNRQYVDEAGGGGTVPRYEVGTLLFDSLFNDITTRLFNDQGTRFYDRSALYHLHGEYRWQPEHSEIVVGGNGRLFTPDSRGTIFIDTAGEEIRNYEFGFYSGYERRFMNDQLKVNLTARLDKNQNFNFLVSPAASVVYLYSPEHTFRLSFSAAIRNPTLADQYLYYNVGRAILLGNLNGYDSLITVESFTDYRTGLDLSKIQYFNVDPIRPERARTLEAGYKGSLFNNSLFVDLGYYFTFYRDFIGFNIGLDADFDPVFRFPVGGIQAYRVAANARSVVTTQGLAIGWSYFFNNLSFSGNYSWNRLNKLGADDPIIPAFNTPEHKFNIGLSGRDLKFPGLAGKNFGFGVNYKWIQGFVFEGSPQFTGFIPTYDMLDGQLNYRVPKWNTTFKIGASNILGIMPLIDRNVGHERSVFNNRNYQVYGGPFVGRLAYFSVLLDVGTTP
jgi:iron complex outermembrane receptor protein